MFIVDLFDYAFFWAPKTVRVASKFGYAISIVIATGANIVNNSLHCVLF
jgi:hypothetical protein